MKADWCVMFSWIVRACLLWHHKGGKNSFAWKPELYVNFLYRHSQHCQEGRYCEHNILGTPWANYYYFYKFGKDLHLNKGMNLIRFWCSKVKVAMTSCLAHSSKCIISGMPRHNWAQGWTDQNLLVKVTVTSQIFGHNSRIHTLIITKIYTNVCYDNMMIRSKRSTSL